MHESARRIVVDDDGPVSVMDCGPIVGSHADALPVVCVHGLASAAVVWSRVARALGPRYRVLAVDLPGHGQSRVAGRPLAPPDQARRVIAVIEQLTDEPVHLVGHSMGTMISMLVTAGRPDLVESLTLLAPPVPRDGVNVCSISVLPHVALCLWPRVGALALRRRRARLGVVDYIEQGLRLTCPDLDAGELAAALARDFRAAGEHGEDPILSFIEAARGVGRLVAGSSRYREAISSVAAPTQVLHGALDRVVGTRAVQQLRSLRPDWSSQVLDGVGHSPHIGAPGLVATSIQQLVEHTSRTDVRLTVPA